MKNLHTKFNEFVNESVKRELTDVQKKLIELLGSIEDYNQFIEATGIDINPVDKYVDKKFYEFVRNSSINDAKQLLSDIKEIDEYIAIKTARNNGISMPIVITESNSNELPIGTKVKTSMGIRRTGVVIPWFNWRDATDGTYSEPDRDSYVAIQWDNGEKGFSAISNLIVIHDDGSEEVMGRLLSDEEYDTTSDTFEVTFDDGKDDSGMVEFEDGTIDNFIIYDNGKVGLEKWYPVSKDKEIVDAILKKRPSK